MRNIFGWATILVCMALPVEADQAKKLYETNCGTCHQMDGGGVPMMQPELIEIERAGNPIGGVVEMILKGSAAIEPGTSDYANEMPAFDHLSDSEIALIATYVRQNFGNSGKKISTTDVKRLRASGK